MIGSGKADAIVALPRYNLLKEVCKPEPANGTGAMMYKRFALMAMLAGAVMAVHGADLTVPYLGLLTNGRLNAAGAFELSTRADIDMMVAGGSKFAAWFKLGFRNASVEEYFDTIAAAGPLTVGDSLNLRTAAIQVRDLFGTPLELTTFVGHMDIFCSGADFPALFQADDFATRFRGYMYYPDGIGGDPSRIYDGLHEAFGTGFRLGYQGETLKPFLYVYQDSWLGAGNFSADARIVLNADKIKLEAFAGGSFPVSTLGVYRGGLLFFYDTGVIGEFYAQIGIPRWDPTEAFGMDMLYFMFEPRVRFGTGMLTLSLLFHPAWYLQSATNESGAMDMRFDLGFGEVEEGRSRGGAEVSLSYDPNLAASALTIEAAPYFQMIKNGVRWDLRLALRAFPFTDPWYGLFMPSVGVSTAF